MRVIPRVNNVAPLQRGDHTGLSARGLELSKVTVYFARFKMMQAERLSVGKSSRPYPDFPVGNGEEWLWEGHRNGKYQVVDRWSGSMEATYSRACNYLQELSPLKVERRRRRRSSYQTSARDTGGFAYASCAQKDRFDLVSFDFYEDHKLLSRVFFTSYFVMRFSERLQMPHFQRVLAAK
jgi:hypothetical protein